MLLFILGSINLDFRSVAKGRRVVSLFMASLLGCVAIGCSSDAPSGQSGAPSENVLFDVEVKDDGSVIVSMPAAADDSVDGVLGRFIHTAGLTAGLGSNPVGLDRGLGDAGRIVVFRRVGNKIILEQENLDYRASSDNAAERRAVKNSFASSVLWAGDMVEPDTDEKASSTGVSFDFQNFLKSDVMDVAGRLKARGEGTYSVDANRSFVETEGVLSFPDNIEIDVALTFSGKTPGDEVSSVSADGRSFTLRQHHSFVKLPEDGFTPRNFDPRVGVISVVHYDFSEPLDGAIEHAFARRFRLERIDPALEKGPVKEPIVFYVDNGAPEPIRTALVEGASWWAEAFEDAGFEGGYRVEVLPPDAHPMDIRYNVIQWVHRQTRGWSYGGGVSDPRTGEMLKARVILGSQRVRQDRMIFEGLAGATKTGTGAPDDPVQLSLARIRQLSAHEVGHTLGFAHNFAASSNDRASVMDYPAPFVRPAAEKALDFSQVYDVGIGEWDRFSTRWLYAQFADDEDVDARLETLVDEAYARGLRFVDDAHGRSTGAAHPYGSVWDNGSDPTAMLLETMEVRSRALNDFGVRSLKTGEPTSKLREIIVPIYLYHRYQTAAAAKLIGGYEFRQGLKGDPNTAGKPVSGDEQRTALDALLKTVDPAALDLPASVKNMLTPTIDAGYGWASAREQFKGKAGAMFDVSAAADSAAGMTFSAIFHTARLARIIESEGAGDETLTLEAILATTEDAVFRSESSSEHPTIARVVQARFVNSLMDAAMHAGSIEITARIDGYLATLAKKLEPRLIEGRSDDRAFRQKLASDIERHLSRPAPSVNVVQTETKVPPGSPIGGGMRYGSSSQFQYETCWHCDPIEGSAVFSVRDGLN